LSILFLLLHSSDQSLCVLSPLVVDDEVIDVVIVDLRTVVDRRVANVTAHIVDYVGHRHRLAFLLAVASVLVDDFAFLMRRILGIVIFLQR
jgi:hypothetical protein